MKVNPARCKRNAMKSIVPIIKKHVSNKCFSTRKIQSETEDKTSSYRLPSCDKKTLYLSHSQR